MAKSNSKRKTHSDKFPLTLHNTGQYCKKIKGKIYYFGTDKKEALSRYLEQAVYLHVGKMPKPKSPGQTLPIKTLCNLYLDHQESRSIIGEIKLRHLYDQTFILRDFVRSCKGRSKIAAGGGLKSRHPRHTYTTTPTVSITFYSLFQYTNKVLGIACCWIKRGERVLLEDPLSR